MPHLLDTLIVRDRPVTSEMWHGFWQRLTDGSVDQAEAVTVLTSLSTRPPDTPTSLALLGSLAERRRTGTATPAPGGWPNTVNAVGTGGGPATFNLTTAAVLVAAAAGTPVVKTGSRGHTSRHGSLDMLRLLGIPVCLGYGECEDFLGRYGIAFAGGFVHPTELTRLLHIARLPASSGVRHTGRVFNTLGPFLADLPVAAQLTGVSDVQDLPRLTALARRPAAPATWLLHNDLGADELVSFAHNTVDTGEGPLWHIGAGVPSDIPYTPGTLDDLAPAPRESADPARHFLDLLTGRGPAPALDSIVLNAAAAARAAGTASDWASACRTAADALYSGAAHDLVQRLRRHHTSARTALPQPDARTENRPAHA